jgi:hypothetical protein
LSAQHASFKPPHAWQRPLLHTIPPAVHTSRAQQGWLAPPQVPHEPALQIPPKLGQVEPAPVQTLFTQQPPLPQLPPAQQASPAAPQGRQMPLLHTDAAAVHVFPVQQASPSAPQVPGGASGGPASTTWVRVDVAVLVAVVVGVPVAVLVGVVVAVAVCVGVLVAVVVCVGVDVAVVVGVPVAVLVGVVVAVVVCVTVDVAVVVGVPVAAGASLPPAPVMLAS